MRFLQEVSVSMSRLSGASSSRRATGLGSKECQASNVMQFIKNERRIVTDSMFPAVSTREGNCGVKQAVQSPSH